MQDPVQIIRSIQELKDAGGKLTRREGRLLRKVTRLSQPLTPAQAEELLEDL